MAETTYPRPNGYYWLKDSEEDGELSVAYFRDGWWDFIGSLYTFQDGDEEMARFAIGPRITEPE